MFFFSSRRRHTRSKRDWSSDVCSSDLNWSIKHYQGGKKMVYDVVIIGAGPGGLAAGLYASRARLNTLIIEKEGTGGQIATTDERSEERRVGKEGRSRWEQCQYKERRGE